jgi:hypothetical protein
LGITGIIFYIKIKIALSFYKIIRIFEPFLSQKNIEFEFSKIFQIFTTVPNLAHRKMADWKLLIRFQLQALGKDSNSEPVKGTKVEGFP